MKYFLDTYMGGIGSLNYFDEFGFDAYQWIVPIQGELGKSWLNEWGALKSKEHHCIY
jgi:hypothetical protein